MNYLFGKINKIIFDCVYRDFILFKDNLFQIKKFSTTFMKTNYKKVI